jgi:opacity protein-like surface antigen
VPLVISAQFEQKISISISGGAFSTVGTKAYMPDYGSLPEDMEPFQMPNYLTGMAASIGFQFNLNRHLSFQGDLSILYSGSWFYDIGEGVNYTEYRIWDPDNEEILLAKGNNELTLLNVGIGITPKYYLLPGKTLNPYIFSSFSMNLTSTTFDDNEWNAYRDLHMLEPGDDEPDRANIESNTGFGLCPGVGLEFNVSDQIGIHISAGYYYILLKEENFHAPEQNENLNAVTIKAGLRFSFLKSKDI